jgi:beta-glucanase (GH16 family)
MAENIIIGGREYRLTFEDNFEGTELDPTKWKKCPEHRRQDLGGYWDDSMTEVKDGNLILWAKIREDGVPISGAVRSLGLFQQAYGYFECRMKMHKTTGFWGAFWMMCGQVGKVDGSAVSGVEIDIIESGERARNGVNHALHWDGYGKDHKGISKIITDEGQYDGDWHTYALQWTEEEYIFYIDGKETWRTSEPGICTEPGYLKLTTEFGTWAKPVVPEELPDCVKVDRVRVYSEVK